MSERTVSTRSGTQKAPLKINTYEEYADLLSWYKQLLVPHLPAYEVNRTSTGPNFFSRVTSTQTSSNDPRVRVISRDNPPAQLENYTLGQVWSSVVKHRSAEEVANGFAGRLRMWGGRVKMALQKDVYGAWILLGERASIRAGKNEIAKWVIMHNKLRVPLPKADEKEWRLLCGLIVASQGGKFLELDPSPQSPGPNTVTRMGHDLNQVESSQDSSQSSIISCSSGTEDDESDVAPGCLRPPPTRPIVTQPSIQLSPPTSVLPTMSTTTTNPPPRYEPRSGTAQLVGTDSLRSISPNSSTLATIGDKGRLPEPFRYAGSTAADIMQEFQRRGQIIFRE